MAMEGSLCDAVESHGRALTALDRPAVFVAISLVTMLWRRRAAVSASTPALVVEIRALLNSSSLKVRHGVLMPYRRVCHAHRTAGMVKEGRQWLPTSGPRFERPARCVA